MEEYMQQQQRERQERYRSREASPQVPSVAPSPLFATTPEPEVQRSSPKGSKTAKFAKAMDFTAGVLGLANVFLTGYNNAAQDQDNTYYNYDDSLSYDTLDYSEPVITYDTTDYSDPTSSADDYTQSTQSGGHSMMSIFNETLDAHNNRWQGLEAQAATAQPVAVNSSSPGAAQVSSKMWAQHQMNMGMLQSNAALFGMHNATMSGLNAYGSSYNNYYDNRYQSHLSGYNTGQQSMITGMAMTSMYK